MTVGKLSELEYCRDFLFKNPSKKKNPSRERKKKKEIGSSERLIGLRLLTTESLQPFNIKLQTEEWLV